MSRNDEFMSLMQELSMYHSVFITLWKIGVPVFTEELPTAAVQFDKSGNCIQFMFNPVYWDSIDDYTRCFIVCHECLHVLLNHGARMKGCIPTLANYALDVAVNHMLVNSFQFERKRVMNADEFCWVDTVFPNQNLPDDKNFEYYYNRLCKDSFIPKSLQIVDGHDFLSGIPNKEALKDVAEYLTPDELQKLMEVDGGKGTVGDPLVAGKGDHIFKKKAPRYSPIWSKILKDIEVNAVYKEDMQFVFKNRRMTFLGGKFMIPTEYEKELRIVDKPDILLFLDCSGSCANLKDMFFELAQTIDPKKFKVRLFARTTRVVELTKNSDGDYFVPNGVGGSDDFSCIERFIQKSISDNELKRYPVVIHITDGYDCAMNMVRPQVPQNWYWFIAPYGAKDRIPPECKNVYRTKDIMDH